MQAARRTTLKGLREALRLCTQTDASLKSFSRDEFEVLTDLVLALYRALSEKEAAA